MQASKFLFIVLVVSFTPFMARVHAQTGSGSFSTGGIYDCNQNGAYAMSAGTINAVTSGSGTYVPVNDSAVTQNTAGILVNTGTLVYKECVLRNVVNRMAENSLVSIGAKTMQAFSTSRAGGPMYPVDLYKDILERNYEIARHQLDNPESSYFNTVNEAYRAQVRRSVIRGYEASTKARDKELECPYTGDLQALMRGDPGSYTHAGMRALGNPACNPVFAYELTRQRMSRDMAAGTNEMLLRLGWSDGIYGVEQTDPLTRTRLTQTPGILVKDVVSQTVTSGFRRQEMANDIGQMVGGLFAGFGTQIMSTTGGLLGAVSSTGGGGSSGGSYLNQMLTQSTGGLVNAAVNAALTQLNAARQIELAFNQAVTGLGNALLSGSSQLRSLESQCWTLVISRVCAPGSLSANGTTCKDAAGNTLNISTSTAKSQAVIATDITPLIAPAQADIAASNDALAKIDSLIAAVQSGTQAVQQAALLELDALVAQGKLHTPQDVSNARNKRDTVTLALGDLVQAKKVEWADDTDPNVGWCNVSNPAVIQKWEQAWKI